MNQALPDKLFTDLSVRGFAALFDPATDSVNPDLDTGSNPAETTWTLRAASERLGLSPNTVRKRIRNGQLLADKIIGTNGPEWRIHPPSRTVSTVEAMEAVEAASSAASFSDNSPSIIDALLKIIDTQAKQLEVATTQLASSTEHVKAASRIITYQQLQLEEKDSKVKLLTDSRHHEGWWKKLMRRLPAKK